MSHLASDMMMVDDQEQRHGALDEIDEAKDAIGHVHDKKMASLMSGLGKIAASLRGEGEDFAADVVEATAISISKEASQKQNKTATVVSELKKIASGLRAKDKFASDLVQATIKKISQDSDVDSFDSIEAQEDMRTLKEYTAALQVAFHGIGNDMTFMGKANKYLTGFGTDEDSVKEILNSIDEMSRSKRGMNLKKYLNRHKYNFTLESDSVKLTLLKFVNEEFKKYNDMNLTETIYDEMPDEYEDIVKAHPELSSL